MIEALNDKKRLMFFKSNTLENHSIEFERKLQEVLIAEEVLENEIQTLLHEFQVTENQVSQFVCSPKHFTAEQWETLQAEKKKLELKLKVSLNSIPDPLARKKRHAVQPHWLFVR